MNHVTKLSDDLFQSAIKLQASDIHFYPYEQQTEIYFRIHGKRTFNRTILTKQYQLLRTFFKFSANMDIGETRKPQHGSLPWKFESKDYALRISTLPHYQQESIAIRILPQNDSLPLEHLFLFSSQIQQMRRWMNQNSGLILVTGATGSGKSSTLYSLLEMEIKENPCQIISLEDPIERKINQILQVQINEHAGISYQVGLKAALRHDPDILMVGEIRDKQTARFAVEAALTGHLVLSTLHAKNAIGTIFRLKEMGIKTADLHQVLIGIGALRLIPITRKNKQQRSAIGELIDGPFLTQAIEGTLQNLPEKQQFKNLQRKAFAYGFTQTVPPQ
ncbi:competence type IV pilus ATPase ComGA [Oceanobacillus sp. J11TS1]|uniref:competence type IV pilus ATPase ComGA n=1 Tax=Oceanobacillus sp. J11TS1 TaxID=2807191 RepID=UPI001B1FBB06|nr:competence type IV pilus ATPase ComGA [Oceanobacillus sp. J11TS1]GIO23147.1 competence protein ComG [Oceanobacillus sp. J11TS1]